MARQKKSYKYPQLNDKGWLVQKYSTEKLGTIEIAELVGAKCPNSVRQALLRYGIKVRTISDGLTCNREEDGFIINQEVLDGCLLGDGFLSVYNCESDFSYPYFAKKNKYYEHVKYVKNILFPTVNDDIIKNEIMYYKYKGKKLKAFAFSVRSLSHKELLPLYRKWYPESNGYKKIVPRDINLTPTVLLHWFLDDGWSHKRKRIVKKQKERISQVIGGFCSESFSYDDNCFLKDEIFKKFGIKSWLHNTVSGWRIEFSQSQMILFYDTIGEAPIDCMKYKWK